MYKLSVITVNYNNASELKRTITSVINQEWRDFEFIIIDGGSKDNSKNIIQEFSSQINYWISEPDNGIYHAMNKGIKKASGEYCFFLNSGDSLVDNSVLEKFFKYDQYNEDILFGNLYVTNGKKIIEKAFGKHILTFSDIYSHTIKHQASFIKKSLFTTYGLYNESRKISADWEFFLKAIGIGNASYKYIDLFVSNFDNNGISYRSSEITKSERNDIINLFIPKMMQADFEYLNKNKKYQNIFLNRFTFFLVRAINKIAFS